MPSADADSLCPACLMTAAIALPDDADGLPTTSGDIDNDCPSDRIESPLVVADDDEEPAASLPQEFGDYRLIRLLGKGGMGVVYEAEHVATGRRVAVKMLAAQLNSKEVRRRFLREGRLAAGVSHPNSVYVFGTEEIEGLPVITMEVASGGTLQDRLDRIGQLPIIEAVDAMLDVIDGLQAALSKDVLHRDIKPSNCFVDPDGRVKVGDFGLSVSTISSIDTFATATGVALGTPAFASPEQLRGNDIDHRSDIYSIGSTLYTLLAGVQPFKGTNAVQIVAAVLDEVPQPLHQIRDDVSPGLAAVVAKCLSKKPESRFPDYASLQKALLPFSSRQPEPEPAPLLRRTLAGMIDLSIALTIPRTLMAASQGALWFGELYQAPGYWWYTSASLVVYVIYFTLTEGIGNASLGKRLLSVNVVAKNARRVGWKRALVRSLLSMLSLQSLLVLHFLFAYEFIRVGWPPWTYGVIYLLVSLTMLSMPAVTMRRHNGLAMAWDKITRTRVVMPAAGATRIGEMMHSNALEGGSGAVPAENVLRPVRERLGPYHIRRTIRDPDWIEATDPALGRLIWLRKRSGTLEDVRRDIARSTRLRWLQSVHTDDQTWDAMEAKPGLPLTEATASSADAAADWQSVRHWLYDLSLELASASEDKTLPNHLSLDHVWITREGHAVLLDQPYPGNTVAEKIDGSSLGGKQAFLSLVAAKAKPHTVPISARKILDNIASANFDRLSFLAGNLRSQLSKPAKIDRGSRATALLTVPLFLIATLLITGQANDQSYRTAASRWLQAYPELPPLSEVLRQRGKLRSKLGDQPLRIHLAGHYADLLDDLEYRNDRTGLVATVGDGSATRFLTRTLRDSLKVEGPGLARADRQIAAALDQIQTTTQRFRPLEFPPLIVGILAVIAVFQLPAILLFARTLGQTIFGFAVVDHRGRPVGRFRLMARWFIVWAPIAATLGLATLTPWAYLIMVPWIVGLCVAIHRPSRGWQERWTRTWLVPR